MKYGMYAMRVPQVWMYVMYVGMLCMLGMCVTYFCDVMYDVCMYVCVLHVMRGMHVCMYVR